jgi:hypothetical protein
MGEGWETISNPSSMWETMLKAQIKGMGGAILNETIHILC